LTELDIGLPIAFFVHDKTIFNHFANKLSSTGNRSLWFYFSFLLDIL